jgi:uncharacterized protein YndB with AHSA1/START domain
MTDPTATPGTDQAATSSDLPDSIERSIDIGASAERVYELVARPGWWINEGAVTDNLVSTDGNVSTVTHAKYGSFRIRTVEQDPPRYVSFRWLGGDQANEALESVPGTLVEFWVEERAGGVTLRVKESGFSALPVSDEKRRANIEANTTGWEEELKAAKTYVERRA